MYIEKTSCRITTTTAATTTAGKHNNKQQAYAKVPQPNWAYGFL